MRISKITAVSVLSLCTLFTALSAQDSATQPDQSRSKIEAPDTAALVEYGLSQYFGGLYARLHELKDNDRAKTDIAKDLYKSYFVLWFATNYSSGKIADFNLRGRIHAFVTRFETEYGLQNLVDKDDPMNWSAVTRAGLNAEEKELGISMVASWPVLGWVLQETKDPAVYKEAVGKFRAYLASVKAEGMK